MRRSLLKIRKMGKKIKRIEESQRHQIIGVQTKVIRERKSSPKMRAWTKPVMHTLKPAQMITLQGKKEVKICHLMRINFRLFSSTDSNKL